MRSIRGGMRILEERIKITINEFEKFTSFIENERPVLSAKLGVLGKKDSYRLNQKLQYKKDVSGPNYNQDQYPVIDLMFSLSLAGRLYIRANSEEGKPALVETEAMKSFKTMNQHEKYVHLLQTYWTKYDFNGKFDRWSIIPSFYHLLNSVANAEKGQRITKDEYQQSYALYSEGAAIFHHLRFFGLGELEEIPGAKGKYEDSIKAFIPNEFGIQIIEFLLTKAFQLWNCNELPYLLSVKKARCKPGKIKNPFDVFREIFPNGSVMRTVASESDFDRSGVYTFKVSLSKNCWRKISVSHQHTLADLHLAIQEAFDFDNDHLYAFYVGGTRRTGKPIYCADVEDEVEDDVKTAEETTIEDMGLYKGQKLYYLFDFGDMWEFDIELIKIEKNKQLPLNPVIIETKGESPEQYGSWG